VRAFVRSGYQERGLALLASPKRRGKLLAHVSRHTDLTLGSAVPPERRSPEFIEQLLLDRGAEPTCRVLSSLGEFDRKDLPLRDAVRTAWSQPHGFSVLSCRPGQLALYVRVDSFKTDCYVLEPKDARAAPPPPLQEQPPPYMTAICEPLIRFLEHAARVPDFYLAGHAANLDFWVGEVRHRLTVLDTYSQRLDRMKQGRQAFEKRHGQFQLGANKRTLPDDERMQLRLRLCEAAQRFLRRCHQEDLLTAAKLTEVAAELGLAMPG
jgi:hypothetical protein